MHYVYILKLENNQFYTGSTNNLKRRFLQHNKQHTTTTSRIKPTNLIFYAAFVSKRKALSFERYLKSSSGSAFRNKHLV